MDYVNITDYSVENEIPYKPTKTERNLLHLAFCMSLESKIKCGKHASFILDENDNVISVFVNKHSYKIKNCRVIGSEHAESGAVRQLDENIDRSKLKLMVVRGNLLGEKSNSRPCKNCYDMIVKAGIRQIIYSVSEGVYNKIYIC